MSVPTYDEMVRLAAELNKVEKGVAGIGLMGAPRLLGDLHLGAHRRPARDGAVRRRVAADLQRRCRRQGAGDHPRPPEERAEGVAGWGWGENRAAWLGGQLALNISWQDIGTQATRPDQSQIVGDVLTIYEPRAIEGARFAPPNIAGSTSCVTASVAEPGRRLPDARLPDHRLDHGDERGQRQRRGAGLQIGARQRQAARGLAAGRGLGRMRSTMPGARRASPACSRWSRRSATRSTRRSSARHQPRRRSTPAPRPGRRSWTKNGFYSDQRAVQICGSWPTPAGSARARQPPV